jgi:hypothetical protein
MANIFVGAPKMYEDKISAYIKGLSNTVSIVEAKRIGNFPVTGIQNAFDIEVQLFDRSSYTNFLHRCAENFKKLGYSKVDITRLEIGDFKYKGVNTESFLYDSIKSLEAIAKNGKDIVAVDVSDRTPYKTD